MTTTRSLRPTTRSAALALVAMLALPGVVSADGLAAGGDGVVAGFEPTIDLGAVAPSTTMSLTVDFALICANGTHVDPGQIVSLEYGGGVQPAGGEIVAVSGGSVGPAPADWPVDGATCPSPSPALTGTAPSTVELRAPARAGDGYVYLITWTRSFSPTGTLDSSAVKGGTTLTIIVDVVDNTPPILGLPSDLVVEGDTAGGWTAVWSGVSASDQEDSPDPIPSCSPATGSVLPLGTTAVTCSVTDSGGLTATDGFDVTVVDTIAPVLGGMPADQAVTTDDPTGTTLAYVPPGATDIVDATPAVACLPASGDHVGLGVTTVTCTATDASKNTASDTFDVTVTYLAPHTSSATWLEPVAGPGHTYVANRGRTVPIKVSLDVDGLEVASGSPILSVTPCRGGTAVGLPLTWSGGRWHVALDTSMLDGSCHTVEASTDGLVAGSFTLDLRGAEAARTRGARR